MEEYTLKSSEYVMREAFKRIGVELNPEDVLFYTRYPLQNTYRKFVKDADNDDMEPFFELIRSLVNSKESNASIEIYEDTFDTILDLKMSEASLGIVTSNSEVHVKDVLTKFDLGFGLFDTIVGNESTKDGKPSPTSLLIAIKNIKGDFSLDEIAYVGDSIYDMQAAKNAGVDGILIDRNNEYKGEEYTIIHSLRELL